MKPTGGQWIGGRPSRAGSGTHRGFDPAAVPEDRRGLRDSVQGRMERAGGSASILSTPGQGCEVALALPLGASS